MSSNDGQLCNKGKSDGLSIPYETQKKIKGQGNKSTKQNQKEIDQQQQEQPQQCASIQW